VIVVTADAFAPDIARAKEAGAAAVLVKPCLPGALLQEITRVLASSPRRDQTGAAGDHLAADAARSEALLERVRRKATKVTPSRLDERRESPTPPPRLFCPNCDRELLYQRSYFGGANARNVEQWDYFKCPLGCGEFQYRRRTRKLRAVGS
jgi:hypothetical protein